MERRRYNAQSRTNPVFLTAKTAVCLMTRAGVEDAEKIRHCLGLDDNQPLQAMPDDDTILGNAVVVEAKYRTMCRLIEQSGCRVCVDLPCGYTPKALHLTEKGLKFIGLDLPIVAGEAGPVLQQLAPFPEKMSFVGVDATNYASLEGALADVSEPICITTEGMMMYFNDSEAEAVIENISRLLAKHGGCWLTPDPEFMLQFFYTFRAVFGEEFLAKLLPAGNAAKGQSDVESLGNAFIIQPEDKERSAQKAENLLQKHGLKVEKINLGEHLPELSIYQQLTPEQTACFKQAMKQCHYWRITLETEKQSIQPLGGQRSFAMKYAAENGVWQLSLSGRLDSISAPELLLVWEQEAKDKKIDLISIDCHELEYISSAGVRLLLEMKKQCSQGIISVGASPEIDRILADVLAKE